MIVSLRHLTGTPAALRLSNFRLIGNVYTLISRLRDFARSFGTTPVRLVIWGPEGGGTGRGGGVSVAHTPGLCGELITEYTFDFHSCGTYTIVIWMGHTYLFFLLFYSILLKNTVSNGRCHVRLNIYYDSCKLKVQHTIVQGKKGCTINSNDSNKILGIGS